MKLAFKCCLARFFIPENKDFKPEISFGGGSRKDPARLV